VLLIHLLATKVDPSAPNGFHRHRRCWWDRLRRGQVVCTFPLLVSDNMTASVTSLNFSMAMRRPEAKYENENGQTRWNRL
jgi:hypothetical protein